MEDNNAMKIEEISKIGAGILMNWLVQKNVRLRMNESDYIKSLKNSIRNMRTTEVKITKVTNGYVVSGGYYSGCWICSTVEEVNDKVAELFTPVVQ